jgi:hypothetical protein
MAQFPLKPILFECLYPNCGLLPLFAFPPLPAFNDFPEGFALCGMRCAAARALVPFEVGAEGAKHACKTPFCCVCTELGLPLGLVPKFPLAISTFLIIINSPKEI